MTTQPLALPANCFTHPDALVESGHVGNRTRIWAFAHVLPGARIGEDCNICDHTFIENDVVIGDRVTVKCGVQLWDGVTLEDDVFVGPNATFTNDPFPRSRKRPPKFARTTVRRNASVGANATILPSLTIGLNAMIGAGAVVTRDVPANAIVVGNPGYIVGYVDDETQRAAKPHIVSSKQAVADDRDLLHGRAHLYQLPHIDDYRGSLSFAEIGKTLPFEVKRYFIVFGVPSRKVRGEHAHKNLHEFLVCAAGSCSVRLYDGHHSEEIELNRPTLGLHIPPMIWAAQYKYSSDAVLLVLASDVYSDADYIRNIDEYLALAGAH